MTDQKQTFVTNDDAERIAKSIRAAAEIGKKLAACGLNRRAIVILLQDATGVAQRDIKLILDALPSLAKYYQCRREDLRRHQHLRLGIAVYGSSHSLLAQGEAVSRHGYSTEGHLWAMGTLPRNLLLPSRQPHLRMGETMNARNWIGVGIVITAWLGGAGWLMIGNRPVVKPAESVFYPLENDHVFLPLNIDCQDGLIRREGHLGLLCRNKGDSQ